MFQPNRLSAWRKKRGFTQDELGQKIKTTKGTISNYENGHSKPPDEMLVLLADVLGISTDYLLGRTDHPFMEPQDNSGIDEPIVQVLMRGKEQMSSNNYELFTKAVEQLTKAYMDKVDRDLDGDK